MADSLTTEDLIATDPEVAAAEAEAREAEALVLELENRVVSGDLTVTPDQITAQESLSRFARLRVKFTTDKAAKAQDAARLQACKALHKDITNHAADEGARLAQHLEAVVSAVRDFAEAVDARNARVIEFRTRAVELGIPEHRNPAAPPSAHGRVGLTANGGPYGIAGVMAGRRRVEQVSRDLFLNRALDLLTREGKFTHLDNVDAGIDLFGELASIDAEEAEAPAGTRHYYRGSGGGVIEKDTAFTEDEIRTFNVTKISRHEAYGE